jgi:Fic family protein
MALARSENTSQRFYSMSAQIGAERKAYYDLLEKTQRSDLEITPWLTWFLDCLNRAFDGTQSILANVLKKARFWEKHARRLSMSASWTCSIACWKASKAA